MNEKIVVSREWNSPHIKAYVTLKDVGAEMDLYVFVNTLLTALGSPTMVMTKKQLSDKVHEATAAIITEMKKATAHV